MEVNKVKNIQNYQYGKHSIRGLSEILDHKRSDSTTTVLYFIDEFFKGSVVLEQLSLDAGDQCIFVSTIDEPTTQYINQLTREIRAGNHMPVAIVGMGGGITMDVAKAVSNLLTNGCNAEDYQGWDLVDKPGVYKIAIPTISGTGAEATRTCVMTNKETGLKLGMNSDHTVYDYIIMDPKLTETVPRDQYFYTGMDAYIHCVEALSGSYRNPIGDAYSEQTIKLCREVFQHQDMMTEDNRSKLMVASYLGGCAIATSYVGVVHPFSAGLSVVLDLHHCVANCITMRAMEEFYPQEYSEFWSMAEKQGIQVPEGVCSNLSDEDYEKLYQSTIIHEKPLKNALGSDFKKILTREKVIKTFKKM